MSEISAPHPQRCSSMTKGGEECKGYAISGHTTCTAHTPEVRERALAAATQASVEARQSMVAERERASEEAKLSLTQRIRRAAADSQEALVASLVKAAIADGNGAAMRELLNRVEGKVTDSLNVNAGDPFSMSEADLHRWLTEAPQEPVEAPRRACNT